MVPELKPIVVVTGGSRGIGLAIARRFSEAGHAVAIVARDRGRLELAAKALRRDGVASGEVVRVALDVLEGDAGERLERELASAGYAVEILVNNAGIGLSGPFDSHAVSDIERTIAINIAAPARLMRHFIPAMRARGSGGIINVASLGGLVAGPGQAVYYASKAALISLSEAVASELAGTGIVVMAVAPGPVETSFHSAMGAGRSRYRRFVPALSPARVARSTYWGFVLRRRLVVPGILPAAVGLLVRITPRRLVTAITGWLLGGGDVSK